MQQFGAYGRTHLPNQPSGNRCSFGGFPPIVKPMLRRDLLKNFLSERWALHGLLSFFLLTLHFHALVVVGVIPSALVWGGRLRDQSQMLRFESGALVVTLLLLAAVAVQAGYVKFRVPQKVMTVVFSLMALLFLANTAGNLTSTNELEKRLFTPLTLLLALLSLRVAFSSARAGAYASTLTLAAGARQHRSHRPGGSGRLNKTAGLSESGPATAENRPVAPHTPACRSKPSR